jgi:predicted ester cyclase
MSDDLAARYRRFYEEAWERGRLEMVDEFIAPGILDHHPGEETPTVGRDHVRQGILAVRAGFPDLRFTFEDVIVAGDKLVGRSTWRGTHRGPFLGAAPTGRRIAFSGIEIVRFEDGKVIEHWGMYDYLGAMRQLGLLPETEMATTPGR